MSLPLAQYGILAGGFRPPITYANIAHWEMGLPGGYSGSVTQINDFSGNGYDLIQPVGGDAPTLGSLSGGAAAEFTTTTEWVYNNDSGLVGLPLVAASIDMDVYIEAETVTAQAGFACLFSWTVPGTNNNRFEFGVVSNTSFRCIRRGPTATGAVTTTVASCFPATGYFDALFEFNGVNLVLTVNGSVVMTSTDICGSAGNVTATQFNVGANPIGSNTDEYRGLIRKLTISN